MLVRQPSSVLCVCMSGRARVSARGWREERGGKEGMLPASWPVRRGAAWRCRHWQQHLCMSEPAKLTKSKGLAAYAAFV